MIQVSGLEISCLLTSGIHLSSKQYGIINYNSRWINMAGWNWLSSSYLFRNKLRRKFNTFTIAWCWISILYNTHIKQSAVAHFRVRRLERICALLKPVNSSLLPARANIFSSNFFVPGIYTFLRVKVLDQSISVLSVVQLNYPNVNLGFKFLVAPKIIDRNTIDI
jgi:hypothetical protein